MFSRLQVEARVLAVYDAVRAGHSVEDLLVELKREWPDPVRAARRIAAHANAARGESVLWLIGIDEKAGVAVPVAGVDVAQWWSQVQSNFDGVAPPVTDFSVKTADGPIHVLCFDSAVGSFVVRNPVFGRPGAGAVEREIPWRDGTSVRSATREDLIRMLAPLQPLPSIQVLAASLSLEEAQAQGGGLLERDCLPVEREAHLIWNLKLEMYVAPQIGTVVVLPVHQTAVAVSIGSHAIERPVTGRANYSRPSWSTGTGSRPDSVSIETTSSEAVVHLPGKLYYETRLLEPARPVQSAPDAHVTFTVMPVYTEHSVLLDVQLNAEEPKYREKMVWRTGPI